MFSSLKTKLRILLGSPSKECSAKEQSDNHAENINRNPWQSDLYRLASVRRLNPELLEMQACLTELAKATKEAEAAKAAKKAGELAKANRSGDPTGVSMKAWWGESVATWDPINGKNVDSIEKQRHPKPIKWFQ